MFINQLRVPLLQNGSHKKFCILKESYVRLSILKLCTMISPEFTYQLDLPSFKMTATQRNLIQILLYL